MALEHFAPATRRWFESAFGTPTPAQEQAWPAIARGEHVLVCAPTGSGKTLAAFLWALDRLVGAEAPGKGVRVVYVSPLKALAYDIERNLRAPLKGIGAEHIRVGIRTGDTSQRERAAMVRNPPDILVTTPESLYLILTSQARTMLDGAQAVIVDEIHAVASTKRGSHLALTLERLEQQARGGNGAGGGPVRGLQRIGLSATQNPLEEVARFLGGPRREVTIVDAGIRKPLDLRIEVPVESMADLAVGPGPDHAGGDAPELEGWESPERSIWPAIYPELLRQVREHNSTIIFVNNRRAAERVALRLNELAASQDELAASQDELAASQDELAASQDELAASQEERAGSQDGKAASEDGRAASLDGLDSTGEARREIARAHHGSLAREERTKVEELLKAGRLPCLVATSSLELGIDMGAVDLVLQIESPKSVSRGLQRIGRAGHGVGELSVGRIFPKFRGDLLESAVVARRMREGLIEPTVVPRNALDVLAQQIVAIAVAADGAASAAASGDDQSSSDGHAGDGSVPVRELHELVQSTYPYAELSRELLENVLDMLDGRYPSQEFGDLRARIVWDRLAGTIRARRGARQLAIANAGTIPDRGLYTVTLPDGRRVGELDEEMVYEARAGQTFLLGASSWRIEEIGRDRVVVTPAPGVPGAVPFWKGDAVGREKELGAAIGAFSRWAVDQDAETLERDYDLDERAARNLLEYLREQQQATRVLPSDRTIVLERFRDEIGDWRLCVLSPYGGRVHSAWALALSAQMHERFGVEADAIAADDGIVLHLPDLDADGVESLPSASELLLLDPDEVEQAVTGEIGGSALFGSRFRENASRALLIPRAYPGRRTPLWQQRLKAQNLLEVARRYGDFPIVLETYRECLRDVLDVPGLQALLRDLHSREISLVEVETRTASPFASSLLFDYVATYMYEGDTPTAERRAAVLSLDRDLLRELLGQEELRELIDPGALERVEEDLQRRSEMTRATGADELHDVLRRVGELDEEEARERVFDGIDAAALLEQLVGGRRAVRLRLGGHERYIAADEAGLYRDALGAAPPGGLPEAFLAPVEDALSQLVARYARTHGPFTSAQVHERYGVDAGPALRELERAGTLVRGELRPGGSEREWCDVEVLRRLRRASLAALRKEIEPAEERRLAAFLPAWQGIDRRARAGAGVDRLREVLVPLQGLALPVESWERDVIPRRTGAYSPSWLDELCASGELAWVGAGPLGRSGRVALYFREDAAALGPPALAGSQQAPSGVEHERVRECLSRGPCFFSDLLLAFDGPAEVLREALWDLVWAGEVTNDAWAPLRAPRLTLARSEQAARPSGAAAARGGRGGFPARSRFGRRQRSGAQSQVQGRWSLTGGIFGAGREDPAGAAARRRALAELLLERYGIVTREQVLAENIRGGFASLYDTFNNLETLGVCRRGYFIEGMGAAQFALPGAVERLRAEPAGESTLVIAATDPAQPYGAALAWPKREREQGRPARTAGAYLVLVDQEPALYLERGGRSLLTLIDADAGGVAGPFAERGGPLRAALEALAEAVRAGRMPRISLERIDGEPAMGSPLAEQLVELGFHSGPRRLTLSG